jgi:hypothetical protein
MLKLNYNFDFLFPWKILAFLLLWSLQGDIVLRYFKPLIFWNITNYNIESMKSKCPPLCSWYCWKAFQWCDLGMFRSMVQKLLNIEYLFSLKIELYQNWRFSKIIEMCFQSCLKVNRILWKWFCAKNIEFQIIFLSMEIS